MQEASQGWAYAASRSRRIRSRTAWANSPDREYPVRVAYRSTAASKSSGNVMVTRTARPAKSAPELSPYDRSAISVDLYTLTYT